LQRRQIRQREKGKMKKDKDSALGAAVVLWLSWSFFVSAPAAGQVTYHDLLHPQPRSWLTYSGDYTGQRHSALKQIHTENVAELAAQWIFPVPSASRLLVTPIVSNGVMYVTDRNSVYALDARTGREVWRFGRPLRKDMVSGDAKAGINRGVAILGNKIFFNTQDAHLLALHAQNGSLIWETEIADYRDHYGGTMAPLVVKNTVIVGTSGGDEGARGLLDAYDADTGARLWRFWTVPALGEPGSETWQGSAMEHGCGTTWLTGTFDPELNLLYWTTGNPCPDFYGGDRLGDNLYTDSVLALDVDTGKLKWYYQYTPHDTHDWDATQIPMLIDSPFHGEPRKLLVQANRNGFFYVLDRTNGKLLLAKPFINKLTWAAAIGSDGRPQVIRDTDPSPQGNRTCPDVVGGTNWFSPSYNSATGLFYVIAAENCASYVSSTQGFQKGKGFEGTGSQKIPGEQGEKFLRAIDIQSGQIRWEYPMIGDGTSWAGTLSTAGGLVFFGDDSGYFVAVDGKSGKPLWHFNTGASHLSASPITYAIDGQQYVALAAGTNIVTFGLLGSSSGQQSAVSHQRSAVSSRRQPGPK
jgi:alcohol dehydrogenase (cytochrome c)